MSKTIAICNQKGGVGKTTTTLNLGVGLTRQGKKVLIVDVDPQGDLTTSLGYNHDTLKSTITNIMFKAINDEEITSSYGLLKHEEGVDLIPADLDLSAMEASLVNAMNRETILKNSLESYKKHYDYVLLDCMPSLGMLTINALTAADSVIIPVQSHFLSAKGMTQLMKTISKVKKNINPQLQIEGILMTLTDNRTNLSKATIDTIRQNYGGQIKIFDTEIPIAIKAAETTTKGKSIFAYDKNNKVAKAYENLTMEVLTNARKKDKNKPAYIR